MTKTKLLALFAAAGVAFSGVAFTATQAIAQPSKEKAPAKDDHKDHDHADHDGHDHSHDKKKAEPAKVGDAAPAFTLTDTDGKTVNLADYKGKTVVIEWFNPECPFIVKHHKVNTTFNDLYTEYNSKDVVFLAINSNAKGKQGNGLELNKKKKEEFKMQYPVLLDESGEIGRLYGAKTTPHVFVVDKEGKLVYAGAVDNNDHVEKVGTQNYVKDALDAVLAGKPVATSKTRPYGCSVKYGN